MTKDVFISNLSKIRSGYYIAQCSDCLLIEKIDEQYNWDMDYLFDRAFDIRLFNSDSEVHMFRSSIEKDFALRIIESDADAIRFDDDTLVDVLNEKTATVYYDEEQFLDIDTSAKKDEENYVKTIGGGKYKLPVNKIENAKIIIRNYLGYEENTGRAYVKDWRIVDFKEGK